MKRCLKARAYGIMLTFVLAVTSAQAQTAITLPAPSKTGGKPLMQALNERKTTREFGAKELSPEVLSNLLWAAFGINRSDGRRTAPSAMNWQEIDIYVVTAKGAYLYDPKAHTLKLQVEGDLRAATGSQPFVVSAPLNLVFVADLTKMGNGQREGKERTAMADTGFIGQNVYLFCASEGLVTVVRGLVDRDTLAPALKLRPDQFITLAQSVGYPK